MKIFDDIRDALQDKEVKIVLPEGEEPRILQATKRLVKETSTVSYTHLQMRMKNLRHHHR